MPENWRYIPHYVCRALVLSAVRSMRDLYPYQQRWDIVRDLIDGEFASLSRFASGRFHR